MAGYRLGKHGADTSRRSQQWAQVATARRNPGCGNQSIPRKSASSHGIKATQSKTNRHHFQGDLLRRAVGVGVQEIENSTFDSSQIAALVWNTMCGTRCRTGGDRRITGPQRSWGDRPEGIRRTVEKTRYESRYRTGFELMKCPWASPCANATRQSETNADASACPPPAPTRPGQNPPGLRLPQPLPSAQRAPAASAAIAARSAAPSDSSR